MKTFEYQDGAGTAHADPMDVLENLYSVLVDYDQIAQKANSQDGAERLFAQNRLAEAARRVFKLPAPIEPTTGQGWTKEECLSVLWRFNEYLSKKNGNGQDAPNSPTPA